MLLTQAETAIVQTNVIEIFTNAGILPQSYFPSPLRLSANSEENTFQWSSQWKPHIKFSEEGNLRKTWDWGNLHEKYSPGKTKIGWHHGSNLVALSAIKIANQNDDKRLRDQTVATYLYERAPKNDFLKGLTRPFFYETARQIGMLKNIPDMHVLGSYMATDQDDFDLFFGMKSDSPDLPLEECHYRTKKCAEPFDWTKLPTYFQMRQERKSGLTPTPAF